MILVAQVSDTHFDLGARNNERVERVMAFLADLAHRPDAILVTGDVTESGKPEQYAEARVALQADIPVWAIPGNHDERAAFRTELLGEQPSDSPINHVHRVGALTVIMLDTTIPGEPGGRIEEDTYRWLREVLADAPATGPIVLAMHHPPARLHSPIVDDIALAEPDRLADVVAADPRIRAVLTGHAHSAAATTFAGRPLLIAPSTASVLGGAWEVELPHRVMDYAPDPAVALHVFDESGSMTTHFRTVPMGGFLGVAPV
ncbi:MULTISPECIES: metallophosphoesterase [Nocardia]|uniref:3',5'-cyclic adenosine monophosphate phosphodiesterase CpdA n=1 Tax=Nocardia farcinica TaxID=37329 RepID=A0A449H7J1_NOCFR|nr:MULTISPECIES: metallophosphoesterase [Nocardia]MBF6187058.1 metallophosphoesterase [Nocardia farcinica]MBF6247303.1 metallophosphoesterase [Nocardia elegans]MBF6312705.1 metallophosphoesterase [Nocardia farcinica]MBF6408440.1 metallophosphoesterase [Nocardia farcinica]PEH78900.1 phosphodiesterase [Nocardia sp. FDAARGOS_372]